MQHMETRCVHSGAYLETVTGGVNTPIFTSSAYQYLDRPDPMYPRYFNTPNQDVVVRKMCDLEGAEDGVLFSSGMAAISTAMLSVLGSGDHVVLMDALYGGTHAFVTDMFHKYGIGYSFAATDADAVLGAVTPDTKLIVIESPTNPLLSVIDVRRIAHSAHEKGILTMMDNTFASPINQNPIRLGVDIVVHSGTKYMGGHSDICCGIALSSKDTAGRILSTARNLGGSLDANTAYLLERSLKTLALRVERQSENALRIATFLADCPAVKRVNYPGLPDFEGYETARRQMSAFGGMLSFELAETQPSPASFLKRLELVTPAVSLGGVETLVCVPAETSHSKMSAEERKRVGISDRLFRLSVGIEHVDDLIADLDQAMKG